MLIIGLGTGRCGTKSLAKLFNLQERCIGVHEPNPILAWQGDKGIRRHIQRWKQQVQKFDVVCDCAFYYLDYTMKIWNNFEGQVKFVVMKRGRDEVIQSYCKWVGNRNHWQTHRGNGWRLDGWDKCYPKFRADDRRDAVGKYYDWYYEQVAAYMKVLPACTVTIRATNSLNDPTGVFNILEFAGIQKKVIELIHANKGKK